MPKCASTWSQHPGEGESGLLLAIWPSRLPGPPASRGVAAVAFLSASSGRGEAGVAPSPFLSAAPLIRSRPASAPQARRGPSTCGGGKADQPAAGGSSAPGTSSRARPGNDVPSWNRAVNRLFYYMLQIVKGQFAQAMTLLATALWYCRQLYTYIAHLLKWWSRYLQRKFTDNQSVSAEVDLLGYCAKEWKEETEQAKQMRKAYEELFWRHHVKYVRRVRGDNYCVLRAVLFQIFSQGIPLPSWTKATDVLKLPEKLLYSQGCNWIQQYGFGSEQYTGSNTLGKLRRCIETLKSQWMEVSSMKDQYERGNLCSALFADESLEHKLYEGIKFIMLYQVIEAYECLNNKQECIPSFFSQLFVRDTALDPLSYMMNHLNAIGDRRSLDQVELFLLGHSLEVKITIYRLCKFNSEVSQESYTDMYQRDWPEVFLLTEDDRHYHIPIIRI